VLDLRGCRIWLRFGRVGASPSACPTYLRLSVTVVNTSDEPKRLRSLGDELMIPASRCSLRVLAVCLGLVDSAPNPESFVPFLGCLAA
jgi:hypothetical protein